MLLLFGSEYSFLALPEISTASVELAVIIGVNQRNMLHRVVLLDNVTD
jgi:hypothetical protein